MVGDAEGVGILGGPPTFSPFQKELLPPSFRRRSGGLHLIEECDLDATPWRSARAVERLGRKDVSRANPMISCFFEPSDAHGRFSMREIDDRSHVAIRVLMVREEGVRVPIEQDVHHVARDWLVVGTFVIVWERFLTHGFDTGPATL